MTYGVADAAQLLYHGYDLSVVRIAYQGKVQRRGTSQSTRVDVAPRVDQPPSAAGHSSLTAAGSSILPGKWPRGAHAATAAQQIQRGREGGGAGGSPFLCFLSENFHAARAGICVRARPCPRRELSGGPGWGSRGSLTGRRRRLPGSLSGCRRAERRRHGPPRAGLRAESHLTER